MMILRFVICCTLVVYPVICRAETGSLVGDGAFGSARGLLAQSIDAAEPASTGASLFAGSAGASFFAPFPVVARHTAPLGIDASAVQRVRYIIGQAESPFAGYDAVQHGAVIKPPRPPTQMTIGEIFVWIAETPGQPHAIGRYQFIPDTLTRVVEQTGARRTDRFTPQMQDRLADVLLLDAGLPAFLAGDLSQQRFMNNLAGIWAGLPTSSGRSKYHGVAGNRATVTLAYFRSEIAKIAPG
ncbi:hypothetical protein DS901_10740 [Loktanella sp. D2R18]|uniref:hypothetical protein n=1 Tax=Rhodobacterales TaxID=204455 RepID=UPI000DE8AF65|nr:MULTISPECIES: hypothetical protein [Rhodobacterales]MDO6590869.1 hypothetical protein [Yoonia sp. 1_MG-2023]RBW43291.1 hypothetical protein DS901_10740 [Loktanella sp. D2R18]